LEKSLEVDNYEHNLKMLYEAKRKELEILLTYSIPTQLSNMKTLLWINFLLIGLMLQFIKRLPLPDIVIGFFILSIFAILFIISAMLTSRTKAYGIPDDIAIMSLYEDHEWTKSQAIFDMTYALQESILENRQAITDRANKMYISTWLTLCSLFFIIIAFVQIQIL